MGNEEKNSSDPSINEGLPPENLNAPTSEAELLNASVAPASAASSAMAQTAAGAAVKISLKALLVKALTAACFTVFFSTGLVVMFYPNISNYVNEKNQSKAVQGYIEAINNVDPVDYETLIDAAKEYNDRLAGNVTTVKDAFFQGATATDRSDEYWNLLSIEGSLVMGYVIIDMLGIEVPLYHGTSDIVLSIGAGHIQGSSLPVGGEGTHAVVSAHTGLPSARFFDKLDTLEVGNTFQLHVMNEVLTYEVDQITIVLPEEIENLAIEKGKDYVTLVTCTPYGINSHRLLVRGERIETPEQDLPEEIENHVSSIDENDRLTWTQRAQSFLVEKLATLVESVANVIVKIAQWAMDIFGVEY